MVIVAGPTAAMKAAVTTGLAQDVYPDERIKLLDTPSSNAMSSTPAAATSLRKTFTGKGVTVGVVDSGCDATHADLAKRVKHNVTLLSAEYANVPPDSSNTLVVPIDQGPYSNTDLGSGHGTHVAGIIAADSTSATDGSGHGVAPDADLACFAIGQVLFTTAVVTAYDYMLDQPDLLGIDVINNSWATPTASSTRVTRWPWPPRRSRTRASLWSSRPATPAPGRVGQPQPLLPVAMGHLGRCGHPRQGPRELLLQRADCTTTHNPPGSPPAGTPSTR